ncbi:hypothetical protein MTR67_016822 [Solanum verrucosum]|uniref:Uncharacterized protein n=1 Tax=Solanum verrucosum TaxID=315347 RepID=A0AAF0TK14_SOLVR|nr:hypothetical protein MTR67_016822 [Solanum verrucosum]
MFLDVLMISSQVQGPGPLQSMNTRGQSVVQLESCLRPKIGEAAERCGIRLEKSKLSRGDSLVGSVVSAMAHLKKISGSSLKSPSRPGRGFTPLSKEVSIEQQASQLRAFPATTAPQASLDLKRDYIVEALQQLGIDVRPLHSHKNVNISLL